MKKIIFIAALVAVMVSGANAGEPGCKKQDSMHAVADASNRLYVFQSLYRAGECNIVTPIKTVDYDGMLEKVLASNGEYYWIIRK